MSTFPGSPRVIKGGLVLLNPDTFAVLPNGIIVLQYNPDTLSRTLKIKGVEESGDRSEALRLTGPPVETFKLDAEIDATDQLEVADQNPNTVAARDLPAAGRARNDRLPDEHDAAERLQPVAGGHARDHAGRWRR